MNSDLVIPTQAGIQIFDAQWMASGFRLDDAPNFVNNFVQQRRRHS